MVRDELSVLAAILPGEKAEHYAAKRLEVSTSALSHAICGCKNRLAFVFSLEPRGVSRRQTPEDSCSHAYDQRSATFAERWIRLRLCDQPAGRVRIRVLRHPAMTVLAPKAGVFPKCS
jgi:hypothetical protein